MIMDDYGIKWMIDEYFGCILHMFGLYWTILGVFWIFLDA